MQIEKSTFDFLKSLSKNNNKEWFDKNRDKYAAAITNFGLFTDSLLHEMTKLNKGLTGLDAKHCVFRIFRDVRFSKNKTPYKTNFGAGISEGGRKSVKAGFYLHLEPGNASFIGGGMWMPESDVLKKVRQEIDYNVKDFQKIMNDKKFKSFYGSLMDEFKLTNPPKGYDKTLPHIELLKYNSYVVGNDQLKDTDVLSKDFLKICVEGYKIILPMIHFLNTSLD